MVKRGRARAKNLSALAAHYAKSSDSSSHSSDNQRPNIQRCLSVSDIASDDITIDLASVQDSTADNDISRIKYLQTAIPSFQEELQRLLARHTKLSKDVLLIDAALIGSNKYSSQRFASVDANTAALTAQVLALNTQVSSFKLETAALQDRLTAFMAETKSRITSEEASESPAAPMPPPSRTWASKLAPSNTCPSPLLSPPVQSRLVASTSNHCAFIVVGCQADVACITNLRGRDLASGLESLICNRLSLQPGSFHILDAFPLGKVFPTDPPTKRRRFFFRVERLADADLIVRHRHALKGSQLVIFDELSPDERTAHCALWPTFAEARRLGFKAQFHRARLFVTSRNTTFQVVP